MSSLDPRNETESPAPSTNPYAPTVNVAPLDPADDVEMYRRQYLNHEASVKAIGTLYVIGAALVLPVGAYLIYESFVDTGSNQFSFIMTAGLVYVAVGICLAFAGVGTRQFKRWGRGLIILLSVVGLMVIPLGTIISAIALYVLLCKKGRIVFSDAYQDVLRQTPHIRHKSSLMVSILLSILVLTTIFAMMTSVYVANN